MQEARNQASVRIGSLVALVILLAGCSQPTPSPTPVTEPLGMTLASAPVDAQVYISSTRGCLQSVCGGGRFADTLYTAPDNASVRGISIDVGAVQRLDQTLTWRMTCDDDDRGGDDGPCHRPLAQGQAKLPTHIEVADLNLTPGTIVLFSLTMPPAVTPFVDTFLTIAYGSSHVTGSALLASNGSAPPPIRTELLPVSFDGQSGPCYLVEPNCTQWPGGTQFDVRGNGSFVGGDLTMTWTSTTPLDSTLRLTLDPTGCPDCDLVQVQGTSPLVLHAAGVRLGTTATIEVYHGDPTGLDPTGFVFVYTGTRTPVHIEGTLVVKLDAPEG